FGHQDGHAGLELRRLDGDRQSPSEARFQPLLQSLDLLRITVAAQDDLVLTLEQLVEGMEELFLRALLAGEELDVIDEQRIQRAVRGLELVHGVVLQRTHHVSHEALRVHVSDTRLAVTLFDEVSDSVHEVRLAETYAAVEEQRVVGTTRILGHLQRSCLGELVALAFDEGAEGEIRIDARADDQAFRPTRALRRPCGPGRSSGHDGGTHGRAARADLHGDDRRIAGALVAQQLSDARQQVLIDPFDREAVGREELERAGAFHRLQRPHPGIELLLRKLGLQGTFAPSPKRRFHAAASATTSRGKGLRSLYPRASALKVLRRTEPRKDIDTLPLNRLALPPLFGTRALESSVVGLST